MDKKQTSKSAAYEVFSKKGYKATGISEIARQAHMAVGSFYNYYESKEAIFLDIYIDENNRVRQTMIEELDWEIDMIERTGKTYEAADFSSGMAAALGAAMGKQMAEGVEIKDLGEEEYLGYTCKKASVKYDKMEMEVATLTYGNLTMKMEGNMGKIDVSSKVTAIDLSAPPASIFEVPDDIKIEVEKY